jgi:hypothetical protein
MRQGFLVVAFGLSGGRGIHGGKLPTWDQVSTVTNGRKDSFELACNSLEQVQFSFFEFNIQPPLLQPATDIGHIGTVLEVEKDF